MKLKAEYRRETYRNYVLLENDEDTTSEVNKEELYKIPMLMNNQIPYLLSVQITYLNKRARYAYDITSNQAIFDWVERRKIKNKDCEHLYSSIFGAIDACSEYLLDEKNLVLLPEYIYYDLGKNRYRFIYHVYYNKDILAQINELSEFLMDHIDYEDERAVLLVYAMYHESKIKEASIDTLITLFQEKKRSKENQILEKSQKLDKNPILDGDQKLEVEQLSEACRTIDDSKWNNVSKVSNVNNKNNENREIKKESKQEEKLCDYEKADKEKSVELTRKQLIKRPIMESRQESERLVNKYPAKSYSVVGVTLIVMLIVIAYSIVQGLETKKLIAVILIVASITAYIASKMFDPKKKVEKILPIVSYVKQPESSAHNQPESRIKIGHNKKFYMQDGIQVKETYVQENQIEEYRIDQNLIKENLIKENQIKEYRINENQVEKEINSNDLLYEYPNLNNALDNEGFTSEEDLYECTQLLSIVEEYGVTDDDLENKTSSNNKTVISQYVLIPEDNKYKQLKLQEFPFYIGKITDGMDAVIMESTISRVHAKITQEDERLYVTDMGSTNGTFVNEENIQPHSKVLIKIGDILRFANIEYTFSDT